MGIGEEGKQGAAAPAIAEESFDLLSTEFRVIEYMVSIMRPSLTRAWARHQMQVHGVGGCTMLVCICVG